MTEKGETMKQSAHFTGEDKEKITQMALQLGADQVSFLALKDYVSPASPDPRRYLPRLQSFIIMLFRELKGSYMDQSYMRMFGLKMPDTAWENTSYLIGKYLENHYPVEVHAMPQHRPFEVTPETWRRIIGPVSIRHLAVQSGMGVFGRNTLVIHPKYGALGRYGVMLTSATVESDPPLTDFDPCSGCSYPCVENCPVHAITEDGKVLQHRCTRHSQPYDVGNFHRAALKMAEMNSEELVHFLKTPHFFNLYMASMGIMYYRCIECTRGCVGSEMRPEYAGDIPVMNNATTLEKPFGWDLTIFDQGHWDPSKLTDEAAEEK